ncbi:MAG TPA: peptidoglycan-binding domain-containing protein [Solirubrobacteraceae bacterium]|nr:peptidoglycan-binding domain-containing protein [Solirubrobacteraceae bacterium]
MANAGANKRSSGAVAAVVLLCMLVQAPAMATTANPGGASAPAGTSGNNTSNTGGTSRPTSSSRVSIVRITSVRCVPVSHCGTNPHQVSLHGTLLIAGRGVAAGMVVAFPSKPKARISSVSPAARLRKTAGGLEVTVPRNAHSGNIMVLLSHGRHSSSYGPIGIVRYALHPPAPRKPIAPVAPTPSGTAFDGQGMWIWYVNQSDGGSPAAIVARAHAAGVSTVFVKSSDGSTNYWSQFSSELVQQLHAAGLHVCAWQYVYGTSPAGEASLGARAVATGADCLVIDAEAEYEGRYGSAQTYIADLRAKIGPAYPLGLASFPYVGYHTSFPYSVFLGPGGAQFNAPQMYWKDIGVSVDTVYANTYIANRIYGRALYPLGQTYNHPSSAELVRFREEAVDYGASGISWWDWQETPASGWAALAAPLSPLSSVTPNPGYTELAQGSRGDPVLWMQEHLAGAIPGQATTGIFDATTATNLEQFQSAHGIAPSGKTEAATWQALLTLPPIAVNWTGGGPQG